jgi:hypothetical protein
MQSVAIVIGNGYMDHKIWAAFTESISAHLLYRVAGGVCGHEVRSDEMKG